MSNKYFLDKTIKDFLRFLEDSGLTRQTIKFYKSDLSHFTEWLLLKIRSLGIYADEFSQTLPFLKPSFAHEYKKFLLENQVSQKTINRRLSTLRNLARFLIKTQVLDFDFTEGLTNISAEPAQKSPSQPLLETFQKHLEAEKVAKNTLKNYLADIRQFLAWLESNHQRLTINH